MIRIRLIGLALGALLLLTPAAFAGTLRILTSLPPDLTDPLIAAFRQRHAGSEVLVLNKNTNSAVEEIALGNQRKFDIFWASSPEAFTVIGRHDGFASSGCAVLPEQGHIPFALSSIGWTRRKDSTLFMPGDWDDLLLPAYRGKIGIAPPSRSGTSHMMLERFLQVRGWQAGWEFYLRLTENLSTVTSRSFGVIDGVKTGRFSVGLTIDFLAEIQPELDFRYGQPVMIFPAQIGRLAGGGEGALACDFISFLLSDEGQRMLLDPGVGRVPVSPAVREAAGDAIPALMRSAIRRKWQVYDADLAESRYWAANALFDIFIADRLPRRRELWHRLRGLEGRARARDLAAIERLLTELPVREAEAAAQGLNISPARITDFTAMTEGQRTAHDAWVAAADASLDAADAALRRLEQVVRTGSPP